MPRKAAERLQRCQRMLISTKGGLASPFLPLRVQDVTVNFNDNLLSVIVDGVPKLKRASFMSNHLLQASVTTARGPARRLLVASSAGPHSRQLSLQRPALFSWLGQHAPSEFVGLYRQWDAAGAVQLGGLLRKLKCHWLKWGS